jgi:hypothetical protein
VAGFFLYEVLQCFAELAERRADYGFATTCRSAAQVLSHHIEQNAWDGKWYRRAYFDDGTPLGSSRTTNAASIRSRRAGACCPAPPIRSAYAAAMREVDARLVRRDAGLIQLLDPPFDKGVLDPGYIRGYVPGVRENGGQYTHAAIWTAMAFARLGDAERAWELTRMINPVSHASTPEACAIYKAEPYVMAADIYAVAPHVGRGGWSWYTGSAGWMYRLIVESLLLHGLLRQPAQPDQPQRRRRQPGQLLGRPESPVRHAGGPTEAYAYAKNKGLDFLMASEHNHMYDGSDGTNTGADAAKARALYQSGLKAAVEFQCGQPELPRRLRPGVGRDQ